MILIDHEVTVKSTKESVSIFTIGDCHVGSRATRENLLRKHVAMIKNTKNARVVLMGDLIEGIHISDGRFDPTNLPAEWITLEDIGNLATVQCRRIIDILTPIADKIILGVSGNHEGWLLKKYHHDYHDYILTRLSDITGTNIQNGGAGNCILRLKTKRGSHTTTTMFNVAHGCGGATSLGGTIQKQVKTLDYIECDVLATGHTHQLTEALVPRCYVPSSGELTLIHKPKVIVQTGSYLKTYGDGFTTYSERRQYAPVPLGCVELVITGDLPKVRAVLHTE